MKVLTEQVRRFSTGEDVTPDDINTVFNQARDTVDDVAEHRYAVCPLTFQFAPNVGTPVTQASAATVRTQIFVCPVTCTIQRAFVNRVFGVAPSADTVINLFLSGTTTVPPAGGIAPFLDCGNVGLDDINNNAVRLVAGQVYDLVVSGTTFNFGRLDVVLHVVVDRWTRTATTSVPSFAPTLFRTDSVTPGDVAANTAALNVEAAKFTSQGMTPVLLMATDFVSGTSVNLLRPRLGRFIAGRVRARIVRVYLSVVRASAASANVTVSVRDQAAITVASVSAIGATLSQTVDSGVLSLNLDGPDDGTDYDLSFINTAAAVTCTRAVALVWIQWG